MQLLTPAQVMLIHESVINENELQGLAGNNSLSVVMYLVDSRVQYDLIDGVYDLTATYAVVIAAGSVFNDADLLALERYFPNF